ncbi:uncharacterized protein LOC131627098 [Vicia villosa]|uniref:uncharacterized protein LOC131627098 n=1 Tax=Vicia villosa TaxID=3911 RepID=UPI00273AAA3D|nr:uncharacterized protein LOC131627098 [Vicia villosa]
MQSRKIHGYPQQQYYDDDSSWMETKAQQLQSQGYPQTQQYPGMKPGYGSDSDYSMPNHHGHDSNNNMYYQDSKPHGHGHGYDNKHGHGGNGQMFPFGATTNHSPHHGSSGKPFKHEYEAYKEERVGSGATKRDEVRYERRGTYGGDVYQANPYGYNNNPHGHGAKKGNWTLKGV